MSVDGATLRSLEGRTLTIRELLSLWDFRTRNHISVPEIRLDLASADLDTNPEFTAGSLDDRVRIISTITRGSSAEPTQPANSEIHENVAGIESDDTEEFVGILPQVAMRIGDLECATNGVMSVAPNDSLAWAMGIMAERAYSQLPVLDDQAMLYGVITWASIAHMHATGKTPNILNATTSEYSIVDTAKHLLHTLPLIKFHDFVLVRAPDGPLTGIVTSSDLADQFASVAGPFFMLGEIERRLRRCLSRAYDAEDIRKIHKDTKRQSVEQLMFGEYIRLLDNDERWRKLCWPGVDRDYFIGLLRRVKGVRNIVMHFNTGSLRPDQLELLERFVNILRHYDPDYGTPMMIL